MGVLVEGMSWSMEDGEDGGSPIVRLLFGPWRGRRELGTFRGSSKFGQFREGERSLHEKPGDLDVVLRCRGMDMCTEKMVTLRH